MIIISTLLLLLLVLLLCCLPFFLFLIDSEIKTESVGNPSSSSCNCYCVLYVYRMNVFKTMHTRMSNNFIEIGIDIDFRIVEIKANANNDLHWSELRHMEIDPSLSILTPFTRAKKPQVKWIYVWRVRRIDFFDPRKEMKSNGFFWRGGQLLDRPRPCNMQGTPIIPNGTFDEFT